MSLQISAVALELLDSVIPAKTVAEYLASRPAVASEKAEYVIAATPAAESPQKKKLSGNKDEVLAAGLQKEGQLPRLPRGERSTKFPAARNNILGKPPVTITEDSFDAFVADSGLKLSRTQVEKIKNLDVDVELQTHFIQFYRWFRSDLAKAGEVDETREPAEGVRPAGRSALEALGRIFVKPPHPDEEEEDIVRVRPADEAAEKAFGSPMEPPKEFHELYETRRVSDECLRFIQACDAHDTLSLASAFEALPKALVAKNVGKAHLDALAAAAGDSLVSVDINDGRDWAGWPEVFAKLKLSRTQVKQVALRNCSPGLGPHVVALSTLLAKDLGNLETIDLSHTKLSASEMAGLVEGLSVARLKSIRLVNCGLNKTETGDEAATAVAQLISGSVTLKNLEIGENYFRSTGLVTIAQALKSSYVESFSLSGNFCRDMRGICEALKDRAETVTCLDLSSTGIDRLALAKLEVSVLQGPPLNRLNLDGNRLVHPQAQASLIRIVLATKDLDISFANLKADDTDKSVDSAATRAAISDRKSFKRLMSVWVHAGVPRELLEGVFASYALTEAQLLAFAEFARPDHLTLFVKEAFDRPQLQLLLWRRSLVFKEPLDMETLRLLRRFSALNPTGSLVLEDADDNRLLSWVKTQPDLGLELSGKHAWFPEIPRSDRRPLTDADVDKLRPFMQKELTDALLRQLGGFLALTCAQVITLVSEVRNVGNVAKILAALWGSLELEEKAKLLGVVFSDHHRFSKEVAHAVLETLLDLDWESWGLTEDTRNFEIILNLARPSHRRLMISLASLDEFVIFKFMTVDGVKTPTLPDAWKTGGVPTQGKLSFRVWSKPEADETKMKEARSKAAATHRSSK